METYSDLDSSSDEVLVQREQIYDNEIFPLMERIIKICSESGIALFAGFFLGARGEEDDYEPLTVETLIGGPGGVPAPIDICQSVFNGDIGGSMSKLLALHRAICPECKKHSQEQIQELENRMKVH